MKLLRTRLVNRWVITAIVVWSAFVVTVTVTVTAAPRAGTQPLVLAGDGAQVGFLPGAPLARTRAQRVAVAGMEVSAAAPRYGGTATWYCDRIATCTRGHGPHELIGAIDRKDSQFREGDRVTVRAFGHAVTVRIVDTCACGGTRLIDLSRAAFARLADPDLGVIPVTLEAAARPQPTAPATDTR